MTYYYITSLFSYYTLSLDDLIIDTGSSNTWVGANPFGPRPRCGPERDIKDKLVVRASVSSWDRGRTLFVSMYRMTSMEAASTEVSN